MTEPRLHRVQRRATLVLSAAMVLVGLAMLVRTIGAGGGPTAIGALLGLLFVAAGAGRLYVTLRGS